MRSLFVHGKSSDNLAGLLQLALREISLPRQRPFHDSVENVLDASRLTASVRKAM
jgi:hypothetical protein